MIAVILSEGDSHDVQIGYIMNSHVGERLKNATRTEHAALY